MNPFITVFNLFFFFFFFLGLDGAKSLGVEPLMTAKEMTDVNVDHLTLMTYISKFQCVTPRKSKDEKLIIRAKLDSLKAGDEVSFQE